MKNIVLSICIVFFISCRKDTVIQSAEKNNSTVESILDAYKHDVVIHHSSLSYFGTNGELASLQLKAWKNGPTSDEVDLGNFYFQNAQVQSNGAKSYYISESLDKSVINCIGKEATVGYDGNKSLGFSAFSSSISVVKALKSEMSPQSTKVDLTKNFLIKWISENPEDDLALYVIWHGDNKIQTPKRWLKIVKDIGSFAIPNDVFKDYNPRGKMQIKLVRFNYDSKQIDGKKILVLSTSYLEGLFKIEPNY